MPKPKRKKKSMAKPRKKRPIKLDPRKILREGECMTVVEKGVKKAVCKLGGKVRVRKGAPP